MNFQPAKGQDSFRLSLTDGVARIEIDRQERKNAVSKAMWRNIASLFKELGGNPEVRAVILAGAGTDFCAGADIAEFAEVRRDSATAKDYEALNSAAFAAIRDCPVPTIAAIRGVCFGGGFGLAAACDLRIATPDAIFSVPAGKLGLAYPQDAMIDIVSATSPQFAKYLVFSAARIDAATAKSAGFLLEIVEAGDFDAKISEIAAAVAANAPLSNRASKAAIRSVVSGLAADAAHAAMLGAETFDSRDYAEGRAAFAERRPPRFNGT